MSTENLNKISINEEVGEFGQKFDNNQYKIEPNTEEYLEEDFLESSADEIEQHVINVEKEENTDLTEIIEQSSPHEEFFHCNVCDTEFSSIADHIKQYHEEQMVYVEIDDNVEETVGNANHNLRFQCVGEKIDQELKVKNQSKSTEKLLQINKKNAAQKCTNCLSTFATKKKLKNHICEKDEFNFEHINKIVTTEKRIEVTYTCKLCNTVFQTQKSLKLHARMHNPVKQKTLEETIEQDFIDGQLLDSEQKRKETFYCDLCDKSYDCAFKEIHQQTHNGNSKLICKICNKKFANVELLILHLKAHQERPMPSSSKGKPKNNRFFPCSHCGKIFYRPHEKVKHERVHTGEKPHKCEICGKNFRVAYCLTLHMRTHTDVRPYVCAVCSKRFKSQSVYNHHLLTHSDARPYQCPYCPKAFKTSVQLAGHKNSHTKPFSCPQCSRPFATLFAVKGHIESHKRINHNLKHICMVCGAVYARGFALKDHIKEQHPDMVTEMEFDGASCSNVSKTINSKTEIKIAEQTILPTNHYDNEDDDYQEEQQQNHKEENVEVYSEIDQFATEEVITDWLK